ncbi:MAG: DUF6438 domain-containing protein [Pyrinomonadaceae bacterium]|nr:hypothetical protein [Pyrinomonadaceae bacterium]
MKVLRILVLTSALLFCGSFSAYSQQDIPKDFILTLERTMCFGWCPAYTLTINADGTVKFTPDGGFAYRGNGPMPKLPLTGKITNGQLSTLLSEVKRVNFFSLRGDYGQAGGSNRSSKCPEYWTDSPSATIRIVANGKRKTVSHYLGCSGTKTLSDLEKFEVGIDKIANTDQWTSQFGWGGASVVDLLLSSNELADLSTHKQIRVKTIAADPDNDPLVYIYSVSGGKIIGKGLDVIWDLSDVRVGTYSITAAVDDGCGPCGKTMTKTVVIK